MTSIVRTLVYIELPATNRINSILLSDWSAASLLPLYGGVICSAHSNDKFTITRIIGSKSTRQYLSNATGTGSKENDLEEILRSNISSSDVAEN